MAQVLNVADLQVAFFTYYGVVRAVNHISFTIERDQTLGIVGESGSGKSVTATSVMGLIQEPGAIVGGSVSLIGEDLFSLSKAQWERVRGSKISMCFQNPMRALNPVLRVGEQITRVYLRHTQDTRRNARSHATALLNSVNIPDPERVMTRYPHQLSGGMCQRVMIVMAIACDPVLLILDEPTTGLDVTIQKQLIHVLLDLRERSNASQWLITHDLGVVANMCDQVAVMYAGRIMEEGNVFQVFEEPAHPYTRALLESIPQVEERNTVASIPGSVPDALSLPNGCPFHPRCTQCMSICKTELPTLSSLSETHKIACHLHSSPRGG